jgi:hypothetical protein
MESYMRPVNAEPLDLTDLQEQPNKLRDLSSADSAQAVLPRETLGQAKSFAPLATEALARYQPPGRKPLASRAPTAISLPEPPHTMTTQECVAGLATKTFYIKSRYAMCSGKQFDQVWLRNGRPVGTSHFDVLAIGTIPKNSRTVTITYYFTDFTAAKENGAAAMDITTKGSITHRWPSTAAYTQGGVTMPFTRTWSQLLGADTYKHTLTVPTGRGSDSAKTELIAAVYVPNISIKAPPAWTTEPITGGDLFMLPPRWDKAPYLPNAAAGGSLVGRRHAAEVQHGCRCSRTGGSPAYPESVHHARDDAAPCGQEGLPGKGPEPALTRLYWDT